jgi:oligoendopeptidase F
MSTATTLPFPEVRWDLSALFSGLDDPKIAETWKALESRCKAFAKTYRGKIDSPDLTAATLSAAINELESIYVEASKPQNFAQLLFACDTGNPKLGAFMQKQMEKGSELSTHLIFFDLELKSVDDAVLGPVLADPSLADKLHFINVTRAFRAHRLSEAEEVLLEETANTGCRAWERLHEELVSNHEFKYFAPGETEPEILTEPYVLDKLYDPDRTVRLAAADCLTRGLTEVQRVLVFAFNILLQDKSLEDRLRKYTYPEQSRHMANELQPETVDLVIRLCREHYGLVARYYRIKREILGLDELTHVDRYAPLSEAKEEISFEEAKSIILDAFGRFSTDMRDRADEFFQAGWIDAEPRPGKRGGAFCSYNTPDTHPVVFQSYLNKMDDVMTLAHELGHGVHASLSRAQSYINFHGTLPLAELASTFGEMLVFESLVAKASLDDKLALYAKKIEGVFATVFRQAAMYQFEGRCHRARREEGEMEAETIGQIWHEELQAMFGDSVKLGDDHRVWWSYVSHFISVPFYVYAYSFGELLALSLYGRAKHEGPEFADKYLAMLTAGGSKSPDDLMAMVDTDLNDEAFWRGGLAAVESLVETFEGLWAEAKKK